MRRDDQPGDPDPGRGGSLRSVSSTRPATGLRAAMRSSGVPLRFVMITNVVALPTAARGPRGEGAHRTAATVTWTRIRVRVPAPPVTTQAASSPMSMAARITGPAAPGAGHAAAPGPRERSEAR